MKIFNLNNFIRGWFIGNFKPTIYETDQFEIACKHYVKDDYEESHHHKIATEITLIITGKVLMNGLDYNPGDIIVIEPGESTDFKVLEDAVTVCVKIPCAKGDKYVD